MIPDVNRDIGISGHGGGEVWEIFDLHGVSMVTEPGKRLRGRGKGDVADEDRSVIVSAIAEDVVVATNMQHRRRDQWRRRRIGHLAGGSERQGSSRGGLLVVGEELASAHASSRAEMGHNLLETYFM